MTPDNDIERVLDQWFAEGPMQMPTRFLDDTLDRIDREPKRHPIGLRPRVALTHPRRLFATAAVVTLLVAGIGSAVVLRTPAVGVNPSPSPSAGALSDPALLVASWTSVGTRHVPFQNGSHTLDTTVRADIVIGDADVHMLYDTDAFSSKSIVGPDMIEFRMVATSPTGWKCRIGDSGTYRFSLSADGQHLTLTTVSDVCEVRQGVLAGDWLRTDMGALAPGRHVSGTVRPFGDAGGQFAYTVPAGWTDAWECRDCLTLSSSGFAFSINLYTNVAPSGSPQSCLPGSGRTPDDIIAWLTTLPNLVVAKPTAVSIGVLRGVQVDISESAGSSTDMCGFFGDGAGYVSLTDPDQPDLMVSIPDKGKQRWILLDRGDGSTVLIAMVPDDPATLDALIADVMPVVTTFEFGGRGALDVAPATVDQPTLESKWTSVGPRHYPGTEASDTTDIVIDARSVSVNGFKGWVDSSWSLVGPGHLAVVTRTDQASLTNQHWDCQPGQEGRYSVALSVDGKTMTLTPGEDACATRAGILAGDWARWPCPNPESMCQAEAEPGRHDMGWRQPGGSATSILRSFAYTLPAGWSEPYHDPAVLGRPNDPRTMTIALTLDVAPHSQAQDCPDTPATGIGTSVDAIAGWLTHVPGLVSTIPTTITIGGYKGQMVDVSVSATQSHSCQFTNIPRTVFTFTDPASAIDDTLDTATIRTVLEGDAHSRYVLLDLGGGHNMLIDITAPDKASWDEFVQAAMPIVNSLEFVR